MTHAQLLCLCLPPIIHWALLLCCSLSYPLVQSRFRQQCWRWQGWMFQLFKILSIDMAFKQEHSFWERGIVIEKKTQLLLQKTSHAACGICDVVLCYSRCWWVEFLMQIAGSGWKQHRMLYNWSQTCLIDMYNQCSKMSGLWYEFNDTEHENKTCQRFNDKKLLSAFYTAAALTSWNVL